MFSKLKFYLQEKQLQIQHNQIVKSLDAIKWKRRQALELINASYYSVFEAWANIDLKLMSASATEHFINKYVASEEEVETELFLDLTLAETKSLSIVKFFFADVSLNAIDLEDKACQCSTELGGSVKTVIKSSCKSESGEVKTLLQEWEFVWKEKNWKCNDVKTLQSS